MLATRIALLAGVAALVGCSSTTAPDNTTRSAGITQAVAGTFGRNPDGTTRVDVRNARNGEQVMLGIVDAAPADGATPAVEGSATLRGTGATATQSLTLAQVSSGTQARSGFASDVTVREYGEALPAGGLDNAQDSLTVIDAEYARVATAVQVPTDAHGQRRTLAYIAGPKDNAVERAVPTNGEAEYRGVVEASVVTPQSNQIETGTVELRADFGAGTIEGEIDIDNAPTRVLLRDGTITGTDYKGTVGVVDPSGGSTFAPDIASANGRNAFRGGFYGPNAEETAGVIDYKGTVTNTATGQTQRLDGFGNYIAAKQPVPVVAPTP